MDPAICKPSECSLNLKNNLSLSQDNDWPKNDQHKIDLHGTNAAALGPTLSSAFNRFTKFVYLLVQKFGLCLQGLAMFYLSQVRKRRRMGGKNGENWLQNWPFEAASQLIPKDQAKKGSLRRRKSSMCSCLIMPSLQTLTLQKA